MGKRLGVVACGLLAVAGTAAPQSQPGWLNDEAGVIDLKVAVADEGGGACGATLLVDRNKQKLRFEGAPGEIGCKFKVETSFDGVKSVKSGDGAGFLVELEKGKHKKLLMIPVAHVQWLLTQPMATGGSFAQGVQSSGLRGPDGEPLRVGGAAGGVGPQVRQVELPKDVVADTEAAVKAILAALGRE